MPQNITVATYNIFHGRHTAEIVRNVTRLAIRGADVICLQEVRVVPGKQFLGGILERALGPSWRAEYLLGPGYDLGLAIYWQSSKLALLNRREIVLPKIRSYHAGRQLTSLRVKPIQRGALSLSFSLSREVVRITNVHLDWQGGLAHRSRQLAGLVAALDKCGRTAHEIICGDLNTVGPRLWQQLQEWRLRAVLGPSFTHATAGIRKSWRLGNMKSSKSLPPGRKVLDGLRRHIGQRLDYIWSAGLTVRETSVLHVEGSDHFPVVGIFDLKGPRAT